MHIIYVLLIILLVVIVGVLAAWRWKKATIFVIKVITWAGLVFSLIATYPSFDTIVDGLSGTFNDNPFGLFGEMGFIGFALTYYFGALGNTVAFIGGLIARPRFLWAGLLVAGLVYFTLFFVMFSYIFQVEKSFTSAINWFFVPGGICVIEGIILYFLSNKRNLSE